MSQPVTDLLLIIALIIGLYVGWHIGNAIQGINAQQKKAAPKVKQYLSRFSVPVKQEDKS